MSAASDREAASADVIRHRAEMARRIIIPQWARWLEDTLDYLASSFDQATRKGQAVRRTLDFLHELQKSYGSAWSADRETLVQAQLLEALDDLARAGLGTIELEIELQRAMAAREWRGGASVPKRASGWSKSRSAKPSKPRGAK